MGQRIRQPTATFKTTLIATPFLYSTDIFLLTGSFIAPTHHKYTTFD